MNDTIYQNLHSSTSLKELVEHTAHYFRQAKQKLQIYSPTLDPRILNSREIETIISRFILSSRFVRVEMLIKDERSLTGIDHRLVKLSQKYTSYMNIKIIPKDYHENHFAFYLIDKRTIIYRNIAERFETEYRSLPDSKLKQQQKYFDDIWQQASPAIYLRALHL
ncbi:DUF7931 domain-containing protein [Aliikangiella sp. IMCC44359]|uniref:DUF7931 domain-containing protein n=1 Tax=Aliikangiella sp. IMCC44359 TaxID=3459125 RepID=UPI00403A94FF